MINPTILHIWQVLVESNTFNFIFFAVIFVWIFKKINIKGIIESLQKKIIKILDEAKSEKEKALVNLNSAQKSVEHLPQELKNIVEDAQRSAEIIGEKIITEAQKQVESIENNATKVIEAEEKLLVSNLTKFTSKASVEIAKTNIEKKLEETPALHEKYINESIDELDRLKF